MRKSISMSTHERKIEALPGLDRTELVGLWQKFYRSEPPKGISRQLLIRAIAYEMQAKLYGGLKPATKRRLRMIANGESARTPRSSPSLSPGTRLVRDWNGVTHVVEVVAGGFIWNGARYRSLSAIARSITAARWSGPRFFGLTSRKAP